MKVYVETNDIDVLDDLFEATNSYECWACNRDNDLEVISLADYTKQVRKEVVGDLKEKLKKNGKCSIRATGTMDFFIEIDKLNEFLDQIEQGELNG